MTTDDIRAAIRKKFEKEFLAYERLTGLAQELLDRNPDRVAIHSENPRHRSSPGRLSAGDSPISAVSHLMLKKEHVMNARTTFAAVLTALVLTFAGATHEAAAGDFAPKKFSMTDLGTLGGSFSDAVRINTRGQVIGSSTTTTGETHAFLWERGVMLDLGTLEHRNSTAVDVNERGQIIGYNFGDQFPDSPSRGFFWERGVMTDLGTPRGGHTFPHDINEWGHVVGSWSPTELGNIINGFLWIGGRLTDLPTLGGSSTIPIAINNRGQVVGGSDLDFAVGGAHAFLWQRGEMIDLDPEGELGTLSIATGINDRGQIIGWSWGPTCGCGSQAFFWDNGVLTRLTLGGASSFPFAINQRRQVVGASETAAGDFHAFLWFKGDIIDLGTLGGSLSEATGINDRGQVIGFSETATGDFHAFLWERGVMTDLGPLALVGSSFRVGDINNFGQIVGMSGGHAVLWQRRLHVLKLSKVPLPKLPELLGGIAQDDVVRDLLHNLPRDR
jgi:probable HAF family extracellular repeat protein